MEQPPDRKRVQEFARKLFGHYTSGMLTMMVDIGHKTGLFEAIAQGPGTSQRIADRAGLDERYVREWLGAMVTGGIVHYDPGLETFTLPPEHAVCLTGTSSRNLASNSQVLAMLARRLAAVAACFKSGGGVPYLEFRPDFTDYMDASWRLLYDGLLIKGFLEQSGTVVEPFALSRWAIPTAVAALAIHGARLVLLDRRLRRALGRPGAAR